MAGFTIVPEGDIDITGWPEHRIVNWEAAHQRFATEARADAAANAWDRENLTPEVLAESERQRVSSNEEYAIEEGEA